MSTYCVQNIDATMYTGICALQTARLLLIYPVAMLTILKNINITLTVLVQIILKIEKNNINRELKILQM